MRRCVSRLLYVSQTTRQHGIEEEAAPREAQLFPIFPAGPSDRLPSGRGGFPNESHSMNRPRPRSRVLAFVLMFGCLAASAAAQELPVGLTVDGPPPPVAPATISRDERNRVTVRAIRLDRADHARRPARRGRLQGSPADHRVFPDGARRGCAGLGSRPTSGCCSTTTRST